MRRTTQKLTKDDAKNNCLGTLFGPMCPPFAANITSFCDLALGTCPCVAQDVTCLIFWLNSGAILMTFGTYAKQFVTKCHTIEYRIQPV